MKLLLQYPFPGNVRELENLIERCIVLGGESITVDCLPPQVKDYQRQAALIAHDLPVDGIDLQAHLDAIEKNLLLQALDRAGGVKKKAADIVGLTFRSFRYRLAKYGMDEPD